MDPGAFDDLLTIVQRADVLFACRDESLEPTRLSAVADCSRATAYRATADLEERELVESTDGGFRVTGMGAAAVDLTRRFQNGLLAGTTLEPVLAHVDEPRTELVAALHLYADATVFEADESEGSLDRRLASLAEEADDRLVGVTGSDSSTAVIQHARDLVDAGIDVEHVVASSAVAHLDRQNDASDGVVVDEATTVVEAVSLDFFVYDDTLVVPGLDDEAESLAAIAVTENPTALSGAMYLLDGYRDAALDR